MENAGKNEEEIPQIAGENQMLTNHATDERELVLSFFNQLLHLSASKLLLDVLPILLLLAHLEPVAREALHGLPVPLVLRYRLDLL